jgi:hypothetical protein
MPPDSCHGYDDSEPASPTAASDDSTSEARRAFGIFFSFSGTSTLSRTVIHGNRLRPYSWKTIARPGGGPATATPSMRTVPPEGSSSPDRQRSSVVLPQPDGPTRQTSSPLSTVKVRSRRASTSRSAER